MSQQKFVNAAIAGLTLSITGTALAAPKKKDDSVQCYGINTEKGRNGCAIGKSDIALANKAYPGVYTKSAIIDCSGLSECSAKNGVLAWMNQPSKKDCFDKNGFVMTKGKDGKTVVEDKTGIKG